MNASAGPTIDLNADVGEGAGDDAALVPLVTSANVACGAHAGDRESMTAAVRAALAAGVAIGAHPGHEDRENFGRHERPVTPEGARRLVLDQLDRLTEVGAEAGAEVRYLKPHGGLYHQAARDGRIAAAVALLVAERGLALLGPAGSRLEEEADRLGAPFFREAFADRAYRADGSLVPRSEGGALLGSVEAVVGQALGLALRGVAHTADGATVAVRCDSLCLHGDGPDAVRLARAVREALEGAGVAVRAFV